MLRYVAIRIRTTAIVASRCSSSWRQRTLRMRGSGSAAAGAVCVLGADIRPFPVRGAVPADRGAEHRCGLDLAATVDAVDVSAADDDQPVGELERLGQLRADHDHGRARIGELEDELV